MDPYQKYGIIYNQDDDTLTRLATLPHTTTEAHNSLPNQTIFTKDIPLNAAHKTWLRLFRPIDPPPRTKLPLILYFHGSGFIVCSPAVNCFHDLCTCLATQLPAVVLSLGYRLSPESRLPAAYEDAVEALLWIQNQASSGGGAGGDPTSDPTTDNCLLHNIVDFSRCYLMGSSAGGNIAYHAGLRGLCMDLRPLAIRGYIFDHPFFGGLERVGSELRLADDLLFSLADSDMFWELSLPKGCNRDHEYCKPMVEGSYKDKIGMLGRCFVNTHGGDLTVDYQLEFAKMLEENGVHVVVRFTEQKSHCWELQQDLIKERGKELFAALKQFISEYRSLEETSLDLEVPDSSLNSSLPNEELEPQEKI